MEFPTLRPYAPPFTKRRTGSCSLPSISCTSMARICGEPRLSRGGQRSGSIESDPRSPIQFSDHIESDGARFFKAAVELGLIVALAADESLDS